MRGTRLVSRKFRSSCSRRRRKAVVFMPLSCRAGRPAAMDETWTLGALALGTLAYALPRAKRRLELSRAKHRSLAGHSRIAKRLAAWLPGYAYDEAQFYASDGAPA